MIILIIIALLVAIQLSRGGEPRQIVKLTRVEIGDLKGISREDLYDY